jgi:hypothetical protein
LKCWELQPLRERWTKPNVSLWDRYDGTSDIRIDGQRVLYLSDSQLTLLDAATGKELPSPKHQIALEKVQSAAITPDGEMLAHADTDKIELFSLGSTRVPSVMIPFLWGGRRSMFMALAPAGSRVVVSSAGVLKFLDPVSRQVITAFHTALGQLPAEVHFLPEGDVLVGYSMSRQIQIWRAPSWAEIVAAEAMENTEIKQP